MMNPEVKAKWVAKLRDPEIKQAKGCLKKDDGFCCLGVLTDLYIKEHNDQVGWTKDPRFEDYQYDGRNEVLPEKVKEWAGLPEAIGGRINVKREDYPGATDMTIDAFLTLILPEANDMGISFSKIADYIEEQL